MDCLHFYAGDQQQGKVIRRRAIALVAIIAVALCCGSLRAQEPLPELRDLNLKGWDCLREEDGTAHTAPTAARNRMKNRDWIAVTATIIPQWDYTRFVERAHVFDAELGGARTRAALTAEAKAKLAAIETQIVSVTGWVVLTYPGPPESCNCDSIDLHDWHIELVPTPLDHAPRVGDPTAVICETTPRVESAIYKSGVRLAKLAEFMRLGAPPNLEIHSTGSPPHKVRVAGYLLWDDQHNKLSDDIGATVESGGDGDYHNPWRATAWEIHPILEIKDLGPAN